jgi:hypothetical protein
MILFYMVHSSTRRTCGDKHVCVVQMVKKYIYIFYMYECIMHVLILVVGKCVGDLIITNICRQLLICFLGHGLLFM